MSHLVFCFPQTRFGGVVIHIQVVWFVFTYSSAG